MIGRTYSELKTIRDSNHWNFKTIKRDEDQILIKVSKEYKEETAMELSPEEVCSKVLHKLKTTLYERISPNNEATADELKDCVISVPTNFNMA